MTASASSSSSSSHLLSRSLWLTASAMIAVLAARTDVQAQNCYEYKGGPNKICVSVGFPDNPLSIELGASVALPLYFSNQTGWDMTFNVELAGNIVFPGSRVLHQVTLAPGAEETVSDVTLDVGTDLPIGTDTFQLGWSAQGSDFVVTVAREIEIRLLAPRALRDVIQLPVRWCAIEGSAQAEGKTAGELVPGKRLLKLIQRANDEIWTPQAGLLFRSAIAGGIPVICDPDPPPAGEGKLGDLKDTGGSELLAPTRGCARAWERLAPDQPGRILVNARAFLNAGAILGIAHGAGGKFQTPDLCQSPRRITAVEVQEWGVSSFVDPALYGVQGTTYSGFRDIDPAGVVAHEIGHQLFQAHGNGLDDNQDGVAPPTPGPRRFDEYCDPLCAAGPCTEDQLTPFTSCEESSSLMQASAANCFKLRPLQIESAREIAKVSPGAVFDGSMNPGDGRLPGYLMDPCAATAARVLLDTSGVSDSPAGDVSHVYHVIPGEIDFASLPEYLSFLDTDSDSATGCAPAQLGIPTTFAGAELVTSLSVEPSPAGPVASASVWRCTGSSFEQLSDSGIDAFVESLAALGAEGPASHLAVVNVPTALLGGGGEPLRLQTLARLTAASGALERVPPADDGDLIARSAPALPRCSLSRVVVRPGGSTTITVENLAADANVEAYLGQDLLARGTTDAGGVTLPVVVPATSQLGVRSVLVLVPDTAINAACALLVQGEAATPATTATVSPEPNWNDWNDTGVTVSLDAVDYPGGSGIDFLTYAATGAEPIAATIEAGSSATVTIAAEGHTELSYFATNLDGVVEAERLLLVHVDLTAPTVSYSGSAAAYGVLDTVTLTCTATDALSGIATTTCEDVGGPAYLFDPGTNTYTASAVDLADNVGYGSVTFTLAVTYNDLCTLTKRFVATSTLTPKQAALLGSSLCAELDAAASADARNRPATKTKSIAAYVKQVLANTPLVFTSEQARILQKLTGGL